MTQTPVRETTASHKPERVFRAPHGLSASIFRNTVEKDGQQTAWYKVSLQRTYRDGNEFKTTSVLGRDELLAAAHLLTQAYAYIAEAEREEEKE
jgi:hypothetical protein